MLNWFRRTTSNGSDEIIQEIKQIQLATSRDLAHLTEFTQETRRDLAHLTETVILQAENIAGMVAIAQSHERQLQEQSEQLREQSEQLRESRAIQDVEWQELRAGQAQQQAVLDYLLRKEQERQNGGSEE